MKCLKRNGGCPRRGSVLVPVVAAVTILSMAGVVLSQTFSAQRRQSALVVESSRAFWTAEAGSWHAAMAGTKLSPAVHFDLGSYAIEEVALGDDFVSVGKLGDATRSVPLVGPLFLESNSGNGQLVTVPLDEGSSNASAARLAARRFRVDLVSARSYPSVLSSIVFSSSNAVEQVESLKYGSPLIWNADADAASGTVELDLTDADPADRVVEPGAESPTSLEFQVEPRPTGTHDYSLEVRFTDGTKSQLSFPIQW